MVEVHAELVLVILNLFTCSQVFLRVSGTAAHWLCVQVETGTSRHLKMHVVLQNSIDLHGFKWAKNGLV